MEILKRKGGPHGRYSAGGKLELLDPIKLPEGKEVTVTFSLCLSKMDYEAFDRSAGVWKNLIDAEKLIKNIYSDRLIATRPKPRPMNVQYLIDTD